MPKCVDCGTETDRDVMYGPPDELRCPTCVRKLQPVYDRSYGLADRPPPPYVTYAIIAVAVLATALFWTHHVTLELLVARFLVWPPAIWDGQLWRFVTSCFFHGTTLHLLFNLYWTWQFGRVLEGWMGTLRFLGFFLVTALGSSAAQFLAEPGSAIGLSGVVYAMFGLLFALRHDKDFAAEQMQPQIMQMFIFWFFLCIVLTYSEVWLIANVAHGAGAVLGWLFGRAVLPRQRVWLVSGVVVLVLILTAATMYMPWNKDYVFFRMHGQ